MDRSLRIITGSVDVWIDPVSGFESGKEDMFKIRANYKYYPPEKATYDYPGRPAQVDIVDVFLGDKKLDISAWEHAEEEIRGVCFEDAEEWLKGDR